MLVKKPNDRIKAHECLEHPFLREDVKSGALNIDEPVELEANVFNNLVDYKGISTLKKAALNLLVRQAMLDNEKNDATSPEPESDQLFMTR